MAKLNLSLRSRKAGVPGEAVEAAKNVLITAQEWDAEKTALIVCDMWDNHWCSTAAKRVAEIAPAMNKVLNIARESGVLIIHAPSETLEFYAGRPQRELARTIARLPAPTLREQPKEPPLPIDDSDHGCEAGDPPYKVWNRQIDSIEIAEADVISSDGDEIYAVFKSRGIENAFIVGVHTNMCILRRPFAIRRLLQWGINPVLIRDMTDSLYNPAMPPYINHFRGTDLVVEHIETYLCPTILSTDITGQPPFRFHAAQSEFSQSVSSANV